MNHTKTIFKTSPDILLLVRRYSIQFYDSLPFLFFSVLLFFILIRHIPYIANIGGPICLVEEKDSKLLDCRYIDIPRKTKIAK